MPPCQGVCIFSLLEWENGSHTIETDAPVSTSMVISFHLWWGIPSLRQSEKLIWLRLFTFLFGRVSMLGRCLLALTLASTSPCEWFFLLHWLQIAVLKGQCLLSMSTISLRLCHHSHISLKTTVLSTTRCPPNVIANLFKRIFPGCLSGVRNGSSH